MPFVSKAQARACWAQYNRAIRAGKTPSWDCQKWADETDYSRLPEDTPKSARSPKAPRGAPTSPVMTGPRGGQYFVTAAGRKVYVKEGGSPVPTSPVSAKSVGGRKIRTGPRGGRYVMSPVGTKVYLKSPSSAGKKLQTGPRGGRYYIGGSGRKVYVK